MSEVVVIETCPGCGARKYSSACMKCKRLAMLAAGRKAGIQFKTWDEALDDAASEIDVAAEWVDNGIGAYEYWGCRGVDKRMEFEITGDDSGEIEVE